MLRLTICSGDRRCRPMSNFSSHDLRTYHFFSAVLVLTFPLLKFPSYAQFYLDSLSGLVKNLYIIYDPEVTELVSIYVQRFLYGFSTCLLNLPSISEPQVTKFTYTIANGYNKTCVVLVVHLANNHIGNIVTRIWILGMVK